MRETAQWMDKISPKKVRVVHVGKSFVKISDFCDFRFSPNNTCSRCESSCTSFEINQKNPNKNQ